MFALSRKTFLSCIVFLFTASTWASEQVMSGPLDFIYPLADGSFIVTFPTDNAACKNSSKPKYYLIKGNYNGVTSAAADQMFSLAMIAATTRKTVTVTFEDANAMCQITSFNLKID